MCQNEGSQPLSTPHDQLENNPLLPSKESVNIDDSYRYHSFPSPTDQSTWTRGLSKLRKKQDGCQYYNNNDRQSAPWEVILLGQTIAIALAVGNFSISSLENKYQVRIPALTMGVVYFILSLHLVHLFIRNSKMKTKGDHMNNDIEKSQQENTLDREFCNSNQESIYLFPLTNFALQTPWQAYLLLAILDVEANYLAMLSFQHTSLSSSMLLTSLSVFSTLFFRRCIFGKASTAYSCKKIIGVFVSVVGACLWIRKDFYESNQASISSTGRDFIYGDLLAVSSAALYGLNDVLLEYMVKSNNDRVEYLGMIGMFGFLFSFLVQGPIFEKAEMSELIHQISTTNFSDGWVPFCVFILMMSYFYICVTIFLSVNDATILNLSLQASPLWAVILTTSMAAVESSSGWQLPPMIFFVALSMVVFGMWLYEARNDDNNRGGSS